MRSKAYHSAIVNLSAKLPLPSTFYQNFRHRIHYEAQLPKHAQFGRDFIYAFTWEDAREDRRLLAIRPDDVVLCLCSAGDNLLDYLAACRPRRVHAVDLNPNQAHLLELKVAAYQALDHADFWRLFGDGRMSNFSQILLSKLSPYLSSQALQFWATKASIFTSTGGLYAYGGSGRALRLVRWALWAAGRSRTVRRFCAARSLDEQRALWPGLRSVLLNRPLHWLFVGTQFLWQAAGVPAAQAALITNDFHHDDPTDPTKVTLRADSGEAVWQYVCNTFEPVARDTLLSEDNCYYLLTLHGRYTRRCHPHYVSARAHAKLARPGAFDGLRIHTDEINDVVARIKPGTLTIAVVSPFPPSSAACVCVASGKRVPDGQPTDHGLDGLVRPGRRRRRRADPGHQQGPEARRARAAPLRRPAALVPGAVRAPRLRGPHVEPAQAGHPDRPVSLPRLELFSGGHAS